MIAKASKGHSGHDRAVEWLDAAHGALALYAGHPAVAFRDLAAKVATEVRLLHAARAELVVHAAEREAAYRWVDPGALARTLPGLADIGGPALVAAMGDPDGFGRAKAFRSFTGLVPKASETGDSDRKGQAMSKAGSSLATTIKPHASNLCGDPLARSGRGKAGACQKDAAVDPSEESHRGQAGPPPQLSLLAGLRERP